MPEEPTVSVHAFESILGPIPDFTDQSVAGRNARQNSRWLHPLTCGNNRMDDAHRAYQAKHGGDFGQLVATPDGWMCPACDYTQPLNR